MAQYILDRELTVIAPRDEVFRFFSDAENLETICPPELNFKILAPRPITIKKDTLINYRLSLYGFPFRWQTLISQWDPPNSFVDVSLRGPYKQWIHEHTFIENENGGTDIKDLVRYRLPFEPLGDFGGWIVRRELKYIFDYRETTVSRILNSGRGHQT